MKRCTALAHSSRSWQTRRWASHDKSTLTKEAIQRQIEAGLSDCADSKSFVVDPEAGSISASAGDLPISPVFDPTWVKARRRQKKDDPVAPTGRFRKKLSINSYARALATPLRQCSLTGTKLPRYFLQDIELIRHPETNEPWFSPGPLAFQNIQPSVSEHKPIEGTNDDVLLDSINQGHNIAQDGSQEGSENSQQVSGAAGVDQQPYRPRRAPLTVYTLNRKDLLDTLGAGNKLRGALFGPRTGAAWSNEFRSAIWRTDLSGLILDMMRQTVVEALITRARIAGGHETRFVEPVSDWEAVRDVHRRCSVLWLPHEVADADAGMTTSSEYATLDIDGVQYYNKMAVHQLNWMLGSKHVARLKESVPEIYGQHEIVVLKHWTSPHMVNLHLLLWRLHGYLAPTKPVERAPWLEVTEKHPTQPLAQAERRQIRRVDKLVNKMSALANAKEDHDEQQMRTVVNKLEKYGTL